jgi:hypothetical protein
MLDITKLFKTEFGLIIISILFGLGLAALFRKACVDNKCLVIKGPDPAEVSKHYYKMNDVCYKYKPVFTECL